jgi:hypothetical protein
MAHLQRALVVDTVDPLYIGRIQITLSGGALPQTVWAMVSLPVTADPTASHPMPPIGSVVWVDFQNEDPDFPVVVGTVPAPFVPSDEPES